LKAGKKRHNDIPESTIRSSREDIVADMNFDGMGRFIYGAARFGGDMQDVNDWMADEVGVARPAAGDDDATRGLWQAFFAKYPDNESLQANHERFMSALKSRPQKN
jgi:hypothetical protein